MPGVGKQLQPAARIRNETCEKSKHCGSILTKGGEGESGSKQCRQATCFGANLLSYQEVNELAQQALLINWCERLSLKGSFFSLKVTRNRVATKHIIPRWRFTASRYPSYRPGNAPKWLLCTSDTRSTLKVKEITRSQDQWYLKIPRSFNVVY